MALPGCCPVLRELPYAKRMSETCALSIHWCGEKRPYLLEWAACGRMPGYCVVLRKLSEWGECAWSLVFACGWMCLHDNCRFIVRVAFPGYWACVAKLPYAKRMPETYALS